MARPLLSLVRWFSLAPQHDLDAGERPEMRWLKLHRWVSIGPKSRNVKRRRADRRTRRLTPDVLVVDDRLLLSTTTVIAVLEPALRGTLRPAVEQASATQHTKMASAERTGAAGQTTTGVTDTGPSHPLSGESDKITEPTAGVATGANQHGRIVGQAANPAGTTPTTAPKPWGRGSANQGFGASLPGGPLAGRDTAFTVHGSQTVNVLAASDVASLVGKTDVDANTQIGPPAAIANVDTAVVASGATAHQVPTATERALSLNERDNVTEIVAAESNDVPGEPVLDEITDKLVARSLTIPRRDRSVASVAAVADVGRLALLRTAATQGTQAAVKFVRAFVGRQIMTMRSFERWYSNRLTGSSSSHESGFTSTGVAAATSEIPANLSAGPSGGPPRLTDGED
jgi:hypothetical protein